MLTDEQVECAEKVSSRYAYHALRDFAQESAYIFANSPDKKADGVAEDATRDALGRMPGYTVAERLFGVTDFKRAGYVILPDFAVRQALLVDSKAELTNTSARIQISQTSLRIRQMRKGKAVDEPGELPEVMTIRQNPFLVTTLFVHYHYEDRAGGGRVLKEMTLAALPGKRFQNGYSRSASKKDTIFGGSPHKDGEKFRTRLYFTRLETRCRWRVQRLAVTGVPTLPTDGWQE